MNINVAIQFNTLYKDLKTQHLPVKTGYKLAKLAFELSNDLTYYTNKLNEILNDYGEKDAEGHLIYDTAGGLKVIESKLEQCQEELDALEGLEIDNPGITFTIDELEPLNLTVEQIAILMPFIQ